MIEGSLPIPDARPDFLVIGAMKSATSTVCAYLEDHPDVFMVPGGEPNFFSHDDNFAKGPDWYASHFQNRKDEAICGEGSNDYAAGALYPQTVTRMAAYRPNLKLVYMVRHPLDRIVSAWIQNRADRGDAVPATLDRAVTERPDLYVDQSLYWKNISRYRAAFPDTQIFVGFMEELMADGPAFFEKLTAFLNVPHSPARRDRINPSAGKMIPSPLYTRVNRMPFARQIKRSTPAGLKRLVKTRLLSRQVSDRPDFSPEVQARLVETLRPDAETFLHAYGKPRDFWRWD